METNFQCYQLDCYIEIGLQIYTYKADKATYRFKANKDKLAQLLGGNVNSDYGLNPCLFANRKILKVVQKYRLFAFSQTNKDS